MRCRASNKATGLLDDSHQEKIEHFRENLMAMKKKTQTLRGVEISKSDLLEIPTTLSGLFHLLVYSINKLFIHINTENKHKYSLNSNTDQQMKY